MKMQFLLAGALLLSAPVFAQVETPLATVATEPSGYDLLVQAVGKILPGPNGGPSNADPNISAEEDLKRERLAVARNAPALALARQALQKPIAVPLAAKYADTISASDVPAKVRELARQFSQEADVRLADGDSVGAMNSKLDTIELGIQYKHGDYISALVGSAVEGIGRKGVEKIVSHLDATQCRAAIARLKTLEASRLSYAEILQNERNQTQILWVGQFEGVEKMTEQDRAKMSKRDLELLPLLRPDQLKADIAAVFTPLIESTSLPYQQAATLPVPTSKNPLLQQTADTMGRGRFLYERSRTANLLLLTALDLRAQKLETGAYPDAFVPLGDPFSAELKPFAYRKTNDGYLLYSVGPDGKDDNGGEIKTVFEGNEPGNQTVTNQLLINSTGDVVQAPL